MVKDELTKLGLRYSSVELGEAEIIEGITPDQRELFRTGLLKSELELMDDKQSVLIEKIKTIIIELAHYLEDPLTVNREDVNHVVFPLNRVATRKAERRTFVLIKSYYEKSILFDSGRLALFLRFGYSAAGEYRFT